MGNAVLENKRVRSVITEAVFALMEEKPFLDIPISDIVRKAGVARASFYRNFDGKEAVIDAFILDVHRELTASVSRNNYSRRPTRAAFIQRLTNMLSLVLTKKTYVLALYHNGFGNHLQHIADMYIEDLAGDMLYNSADRYILYCFSGAAMNMLIHWLVDGTKESPQ